MSTLFIQPEPLTSHAFAAYGQVLGRPYCADVAGFSNPASDFWHQHYFQAGHDAMPEVLWVNYRNGDPTVTELEVHWKTQQAIVPLGQARIIHIVALSRQNVRAPNPKTVRAFYVNPGQGICMNPGCWHTTRIVSDESTCLMLTRGSTTIDLVRHLRGEAQAQESGFAKVDVCLDVAGTAGGGSKNQ